MVKKLPAKQEMKSGSGRFPWTRKWQPTPVFLPEKSHGQKELGGLQSMGSQKVRHDLATMQGQDRERDGVEDQGHAEN